MTEERAAKEPTHFLLDVFPKGGATQVECICGRVHDGTDEEPVLWVEVAGTTAVEGCRCEWLWRLERMLWNERGSIVRYYAARRAHEAQELAGLDAEVSATTTPKTG